MMEVPEGSTANRYDSLTQVKKSGGDPPELKNIPPMSEYASYIWGIYSKLGNDSYSEIQAFCSLSNIDLSPGDVDLIKSISIAKYNVKRPVNG